MVLSHPYVRVIGKAQNKLFAPGTSTFSLSTTSSCSETSTFIITGLMQITFTLEAEF
jgi:hypothetical protein